jgi:hypothetical protein
MARAADHLFHENRFANIGGPTAHISPFCPARSAAALMLPVYRKDQMDKGAEIPLEGEK